MNREVDLVKGLADPTRLRIMGLLARAGGELCVCQIEAALGESQYKISRHLKILKNAGWLAERRDGRWVHYRLTRPQGQFRSILERALNCLDDDFIRLRVKIRDLPSTKKVPARRKET